MSQGVAAVDITGKTQLAGYMAMPDNVSRAGSLHLLGGHLALDFANTASGRGSPTHQEHLRTAANVVEWACHARVISTAQAKRLRSSPATLLEDATHLRNLIHEVGEALAHGRHPRVGDVSSLAKLHANALRSADLKRGQGRYHWFWDLRGEAILGPIAQSAIDMLTALDPLRVKQCAGRECGWLFYDHTKNNSRRWCDMSVCGNRAKARMARQRSRKGA
jgi:predicted RNA-binding Zn ribbon-like protein